MRGATALFAAAAVGLGGLAVSSAQAIPITLFENTASADFAQGTSSQGYDTEEFHSGERSWRISYSGAAFPAVFFNLQDGQASINDVINNPFSFWYKTEDVGSIQFDLLTFADGNNRRITNRIITNLNTSGEWTEIVVNFTDNPPGESDQTWLETADYELARNLKMSIQAQFVGDTAQVANYDSIRLIPEPGALGLLGLGGLMLLRRRRRQVV